MPARSYKSAIKWKRAGTEACPYEWLSGINSASELEIRYHGRAQRPSPTRNWCSGIQPVGQTQRPAQLNIYYLLRQLIPNDAHVFAVNIRAATGLCPTDVRPLVCREAGMCIA